MINDFEHSMITKLMKSQERQLETLERILNILELYIVKDKEIENE